MPSKQITSNFEATFSFSSTMAGPPYYFSRATGTVVYSDNSALMIKNWKPETVGSPDKDGAEFTIVLVDDDAAIDYTNIGRWAVTFLPKDDDTKEASPFGNNLPTVLGQGAALVDGQITLEFDKYTIKKQGKWDWSLIVQVNFDDSTSKCFVSDPEMDVDPTAILGGPKAKKKPRPVRRKRARAVRAARIPPRKKRR